MCSVGLSFANHSDCLGKIFGSNNTYLWLEKENPAQYNYSSFVNNVNITHCYLPHPAPSHISALYLSDCCRGRVIVQASGEVADKFGSFLGDFYRSTSSIGEIIYNDPRNVGNMLQRVQNRWHGEFYMLNSENQIVNFKIESAEADAPQSTEVPHPDHRLHQIWPM